MHIGKRILLHFAGGLGIKLIYNTGLGLELDLVLFSRLHIKSRYYLTFPARPPPLSVSLKLQGKLVTGKEKGDVLTRK